MRIERQVLFWCGAALAALLAIGLLKEILLPFVAGITIAYFLNPLAEALSRAGLSRTWSALLIVAGGMVLLGIVLVFVVPMLVHQAQQLGAALPEQWERAKGMIDTWARARLGARYPEFMSGLDKAAASLSDNWASLAAALAQSIWSQGRALFNFASLLLVTPLVVFYLLIDWHPMIEKVDAWLPRAHAPTIRKLASDVNDAVAAFIRGQGAVCLVLGAFYGLGLSLIGLNYGLLVGIATGLMAFVPFVGWALGLIAALAIALVQFGPELKPLLLVAGVFLAGQALDAGFLSPKIVGSKIGLHPVWLIFALFVFSYLFGFVGVLVAVPMAAAIGVLVRFALDVYLRSSVYTGEPAAPPRQDGPR